MLSRPCIVVALFAALSPAIPRAAGQSPAASQQTPAPDPGGASEFDRVNAERDPLITQFNEQYTAKKSSEALATREKVIPLERRTLELAEARFPGDKASRRLLAERLYDSLQYVAYEQTKQARFADSAKNWTDAQQVATAEFGPEDWRVRESRSRQDTAKALAVADQQQQADYIAGLEAMTETVSLLGADKPDEAAKVGERAIELITKALGPDHFEIGTCLNNLAMVRGRQNQPEEAAKLFLQSEQILRKTLGDHPSTARTLANYGSALLSAGKRELAEPIIRAGYDMRQSTLGAANGATADSAFGLGVVLFELGRPRDAIPLFSQNLDFIRSTNGENSPLAANSLQYIGRALLQLGDVDEAVKCLEQAVELKRGNFGEEHAETLVALVNLAEAHSRAGDPLKSSAYLEQAGGIARKILEPNHPFIGRVLNDLGVAYINLKSYSKAIPNLQEALAVRKAAFGEEHEQVRISLHNLGVAQRDKGDYAPAEAVLKQAQAVAEKTSGHDSIAAGDALFALGGLYVRQQRLDEAEKCFRDAIARTDKSAAPGANLGVRSELAALYESAGRFPEARDQLEAMHDIAVRTVGRTAPVSQRIVERLGAVYEKTGDKQKLDQLVSAARNSANETNSANNLKQLGLALMNYHDTRGTYPPAGSTTVDGAPRLSWRVHVLPYVEDGGLELYKKFKLDEPWDSEHNRALIAEMPSVFKSAGADVPPGKTLYLAVAGPDGLFGDGSQAVRIRDITDGMSNTLMLVEADPEAAVEWTRPADWEFNAAQPFAGVGKLRTGKFLTLFADGSTRKLEAAGAPEKFKAFVTPRGGEVIEIE